LNVAEGVKQAVSTVARSTNTILSAIGIHSGSLDNIGHRYTHILGETFYTIAPIRYGDYVAKLALVPSSDNLGIKCLPSLAQKAVRANSHSVRFVLFTRAAAASDRRRCWCSVMCHRSVKGGA